MSVLQNHIISESESVISALAKLDKLGADAILFVIDQQYQLRGSLTDGDLRRGFLNGLDFGDSLEKFIQPKPHYILKNDYSLDYLKALKEKNFKIIPILDERHAIIDILNFRHKKTLLPIDVVIMAGGEGKRLRPLTISIPKPLLPVGDKPIIEHNIDRLVKYGIEKLYLSINYLGDQLINYFGDGADKNLCIEYIQEEESLGTIGAVGMIDEFAHDIIMVMNSDLLTNIDFEDFYNDFVKKDADMGIASIPYYVEVPYAVLETNGDSSVHAFHEKPTYTYFSNGGIYLIKKSVLKYIPRKSFFNATDLMHKIMQEGGKVQSYHLLGYWLDIGRHEDYKKAQEDIKHIKL